MWPYVPCQVCEPVAVEVGEEHLGLAYVRVTVEHSSYKLLSPKWRLRTLAVSHRRRPEPGAERERREQKTEESLVSSLLAPAHKCEMGETVTESGVYCFSPTQHTFFYHRRRRTGTWQGTHTHTHAHTLFCTTRDTVARTHTATDGHTRVHPRATTYAANHTSTLWLNCRVQRHAVGITHVESSEEVIAHCH